MGKKTKNAIKIEMKENVDEMLTILFARLRCNKDITFQNVRGE